MLRKCELGSKYESVHSWREKIKMNENDLVESKQQEYIEPYMLAKNGAGVTRYLRSVQSQEVMRLLFRQVWLSQAVGEQEEM